MKENDPDMVVKYQMDLDKAIFVDLNMKKLQRVDDLYNDKTTFV